MKKTRVIVAGILAVVAAVSTVSATTLSRGAREVLFSGMYDLDSASGGDLDFSAGYGYFVEDNREFGVRGGLRNNDDTTFLQVGPFHEWSFERGTPLVPFTGLHATIATAEITTDEDKIDNQALVIGCSLGARYFIVQDIALTRHMAISGEFIFDFATDKIYVEGNNPKNIDWRLEGGLRFFF